MNFHTVSKLEHFLDLNLFVDVAILKERTAYFPSKLLQWICEIHSAIFLWSDPECDFSSTQVIQFPDLTCLQYNSKLQDISADPAG